MLRKIAFVILIACLTATPVFSIDPLDVTDDEQKKVVIDPANWKKEKLYIDRAFGKLNYSTWNFFFGWTEILTEPYEAVEINDNVIKGVAKGVFNAVFDTAGGFINMFTFPLTFLNFPLPEGGIESREF